MSLLQDKLTQKRQSIEEAENKVENAVSLKPTDEENECVDKIITAISARFSDAIAKDGISDQLKSAITAQVDKEVDSATDDYERRSRIRRLVLTTMFGLGPLEPSMKPGSTVTDIIVQKYNQICVEDNTGMHRIPAEFNSEQQLRNVVQRIVQQAGRQINLSSPAVDAKLPDGSRVHATIPPITPDGATLTIRRFNNNGLGADDYLRLHTLNDAMLRFLRCSVEGKLSILVCGGTGAGKTTLLNMLSSFIPENELIITIEDNCELQLRQPNVRRMEARAATGDLEGIGIQELVKHSLRMRPDRIIVGEVRDGTVVDMLAAMSTGHEGSMSTVHTNSPRTLVDSRLPTLFSMYKGGALPRETQVLMTAEAVHLIVQIAREPNRMRRITHITAVDGVDYERNYINLTDIYRYNRADDSFSMVNDYPQQLLSWLTDHGIDISRLPRKEDCK